MSDHPMGFLPQPSASAMGFHIAITTGDNTRLSVEPIRSFPYLLCDCAFPSLMNAPEAGLMRSGWRRPSITSSMASPEPIGIACTKIGLLLLVRWFSRLKLSVTSLIHFSFSEPYVNVSCTLSADGVGASRWDFDLQLERTLTNKSAEAAQIAALTTVDRRLRVGFPDRFIYPQRAMEHCRATASVGEC